MEGFDTPSDTTDEPYEYSTDYDDDESEEEVDDVERDDVDIEIDADDDEDDDESWKISDSSDTSFDSYEFASDDECMDDGVESSESNTGYGTECSSLFGYGSGEEVFQGYGPGSDGDSDEVIITEVSDSYESDSSVLTMASDLPKCL